MVPPGRDVASAAGEPTRDLRAGARAALLCVGNWVARKGILPLLDAAARLPAGLARLHLAGDDRSDPGYAARVHRRLARGDLAGRVECHGAGNLPYLAGDGQEGLLVEPGSVAGLAAALRRLAEDGELRTRLGTAARRRAAAFPTWEQTAERFFTAVRAASG